MFFFSGQGQHCSCRALRWQRAAEQATDDDDRNAPDDKSDDARPQPELPPQPCSRLSVNFWPGVWAEKLRNGFRTSDWTWKRQGAAAVADMAAAPVADKLRNGLRTPGGTLQQQLGSGLPGCQ